MWLLWGRELAGGTLDTAEGPAFKPLPVALGVLLAPLGELAPTAWLGLARTAGLAAIGLAAVLAAQLAGDGGRAPTGPPRLAAGLAALGVGLTGSFLALSAAGAAEGLFVAALLASVLLWRSGRRGLALLGGLLCALVRVEAVPFLVLAAVPVWRKRPRARPVLALGLLALPAAWLLPDLLAADELLRSAGRARIPNPGQPALAEVPALESLRRAAGLALAPVALGVLLLRPERDRVAARLALAALAWVLLVAGMSQLGFSGEERYALPGVALLGVAGAVGLARLGGGRRWGPAVVLALALLAALPRLGGLPEERERLARAARLAGDLERAVGLAGGREAVLACGRPVVGPLRGPLLAYALAVAKRRVAFDPGAPGVVFVSRLSHERRPAPRVPPGHVTLARAGSWRVLARCGQERRRPTPGAEWDEWWSSSASIPAPRTRATASWRTAAAGSSPSTAGW